MRSRDLNRDHLTQGAGRVPAHIDVMGEHALVLPKPHGGCHTLWVRGHQAFIEAQIMDGFMLGLPHPLAARERPFDGEEPSAEAGHDPPFDEVLAICRATRQATLARLEELSEDELDTTSARCPTGWEAAFGTYRRCFPYVADHWYMHRGHRADARRAARLPRMWV